MKNGILKKLFALTMCLAMIFVLAASVSAEGLFTKNLKSATDEELAEAAEQIKAEQKSRVKTSIKLEPEQVTVGKGLKQKINASVADLDDGVKAGKFTWTSSDETVATCKNGTIQSIGSGKATITCATFLSDGTELSAACEVTVILPVESVVPAQKKVSILAGESKQLSVQVFPANAENKNLTWESSNPDIVKVSEDGKITAVTEGKAKITVTAADGSGKNAKISVTVEPRGILGKWVSSTSENTILEFKTDGTMSMTIYSNNDGKTVVSESFFTYKAKGNKIIVTSIMMKIYANGKTSTIRNSYTSHGTVKGDTFTWKTLKQTQVYYRK